MILHDFVWNEMQTYNLGQILYVVLRKEPNVYPMQVIEIQNKKTLEGEVTTYMLRAGADSNKVIAMANIDGEIFDSSENAKRTLLERVSQSINQRIEQAVAKAKEWYPSGFEHAIDDPLSLVKKTSLTNELPQQQRKPWATNLKPEIAQLAAEFAAETVDSLVMEVPGPDGTMQKVKIKGVEFPPAIQS